jgi:hypothetical protein
MDPETAQEITETPKTRTSDVHELIDLTEATLDSAGYAAGVRIIKAGWSLNADSKGRRRNYPDKTLAEAAPKWEGVRVYADHPSKEDIRNRPERSVRDLIGVIEGVTHQDGTTRGTLHVMGQAREWAWPLIEESVRTGRSVAGLSINAVGRTIDGEIDGQKASVVEAITHASSVDMVTTPAAGGGFERLVASDDGWTRAVVEALTLDELREARPDFIADLKREWKTTRDSEAIQEARATADDKSAQLAVLTEENRTTKDALAEALDTIVELRKERAVDRLLEDAKLPKDVSKELREKLLAAEDTKAMQAVIETAIATLSAVRLPVRVHGAGRAASPTQTVSTRKQVNPIAEAMGVDPRLAGADTFEEFLAMQKTLNQGE